MYFLLVNIVLRGIKSDNYSTFVFSCNMHLNMDYLLECVWNNLNLLRIYTKKPSRAPDFSDPIILRGGANVEHVCHSIHRSIVATFKYALVWVSIKYNIYINQEK